MEPTFVQLLRSALVALRPVIAARADIPVVEYNRVTWLLSVPDEQLATMAQWIEAMDRRYVQTLKVVEVQDGKTYQINSH